MTTQCNEQCASCLHWNFPGKCKYAHELNAGTKCEHRREPDETEFVVFYHTKDKRGREYFRSRDFATPEAARSFASQREQRGDDVRGVHMRETWILAPEYTDENGVLHCSSTSSRYTRI